MTSNCYIYYFRRIIKILIKFSFLQHHVPKEHTQTITYISPDVKLLENFPGQAVEHTEAKDEVCPPFRVKVSGVYRYRGLRCAHPRLLSVTRSGSIECETSEPQRREDARVAKTRESRVSTKHIVIQ